MNGLPILFGWFAGLISNSVYLPEGQAGVKSGLWPEVCLKVAHRCLNSDTFVLNRVKMRSIKYETLRTSTEYSGEEFSKQRDFDSSEIFSVRNKQCAIVSTRARH